VVDWDHPTVLPPDGPHPVAHLAPAGIQGEVPQRSTGRFQRGLDSAWLDSNCRPGPATNSLGEPRRFDGGGSGDDPAAGYWYQPEALAEPARLEADTLYVVGGLHGNPAALQALLERADRAEMEHFATTIETGSTPSPGFTDGRAALVLADAANESLRTGMTVKVVGA
jgi:hypothetical protein